MDRYENSYKKSCSKSRVDYKPERVVVDKNRFKKFLIAAAITITCVSSAITGVTINLINNVQESQEVQEYIEPYYQIVSNNTHRTKDNQNYWYDTVDMANELLEDSEHFDEKFYAVYKRIGYNDANKIKHLDEILRIMDGRISCDPDSYQNLVGCESFDDFLIKNSYVDEDGYPSREEYEEQMTKYISAKAQLEEIQDKKSTGK